jgi:hypothetical protein
MVVEAVSTTTAVLLSAAIGVAGADFGAAAAGFASYKIEGRGQTFARSQDFRAERRERERELAVTRGVARVWFGAVKAYVDLYGVIHARGKEWWPDYDHSIFVPSISLEDRKLVAKALGEDEWDTILAMDRAIDVMESFRAMERRNGEVPSDRAGPTLSAEALTAIQILDKKCKPAVGVLQRLAAAKTD